MITMLVSGLWHGLSLHMLVWGGLHGLYQIVERIPSLWRPVVPPQNQPLWRQWLGMGVVFVFVVLAWVPFRWELPAAFELWGHCSTGRTLASAIEGCFLVLPILFVSLLIDHPAISKTRMNSSF
jgi:D-alanyl-lipoteichoic acid acyltransferase DltB (MBOAT superfamily)